MPSLNLPKELCELLEAKGFDNLYADWIGDSDKVGQDLIAIYEYPSALPDIYAEREPHALQVLARRGSIEEGREVCDKIQTALFQGPDACVVPLASCHAIINITTTVARQIMPNERFPTMGFSIQAIVPRQHIRED